MNAKRVAYNQAREEESYRRWGPVSQVRIQLEIQETITNTEAASIFFHKISQLVPREFPYIFTLSVFIENLLRHYAK